MNDYKELITELRKCKYCAPNIAKYSADAIEQLVMQLVMNKERDDKIIASLQKELVEAANARDAAVADLKGHCHCSDCKHLDVNNRCKENHSCFDVNHWEWRGVQEDER